MKYDDAETYLLNFETEIPNASEASGTHIGFYLAWIVNNGMASDDLSAHAESVRQRTSSGCALLFDRCDGKLMSSDLNERGNAFTEAYYHSRYFSDYAEVFMIDAEDPDGHCKVENTWSNYDKLVQRLDARFREWQAAAALPNRVDLLGRMETEFVPLLEQMGFTRDPYSFSGSMYERSVFVKSGPWGSHSIFLCAVDERPGFYGIAVEVTSTLFELSQAIYDDLVIDNPYESRAPRSTFYAPTHRWLGNWPVPFHTFRGGPMTVIPITDSQQIQPVIAMVSKRAASKLPSLLQSLETLEGNDRHYCTEPLSASPSFSGYSSYISCIPLLCAELAGNPRLLAICDEIEQALNTLPELGQPELVPGAQQMRRRIQRIRERVSSKQKRTAGD